MNIEELTKIINEGKLAIIPTDTVYGIIGDATNENTIHNVFKVKKRPYTKPLIIMVSSIQMLKEYTRKLSDLENKLIEEYWPGPLTILLPKNNKISNYITNDSPLVGIRLPKDKELLELINKLNKPLISTSANITGTETITNINMLEDEMIKQIPYIYDKGEILNPASTIVKVENDKVIILREGSLTKSIQEKFINN